MVSAFIDTLRAARLVPVIRHADIEVARQACHLLVEEGVGVLEITFTVPGAAGLISELKDGYPGVTIGAGTVLSASQAGEALDAGCAFLVSPCWADDVAAAARQAECPYLPGAMTPGEVLHNWNTGASAVKVFPADAAGGPAFLKALAAVFPDIPLMPTGGVTPETAADFLAAGALCVGMGGNLLPAAALRAGDMAAARSEIRAALAALPKQET